MAKADKSKHPYYRHRASLRRDHVKFLALTDSVYDHPSWKKLSGSACTVYQILIHHLKPDSWTVKVPAPRHKHQYILPISRPAWWVGIDELDGDGFIKIIEYKQKGRRSGEYELLIL